MNPRPVEAEAIDHKTLLIKFGNDEVKKVDISVFFQYPMYKKLNNYSFFKQVKADGMTVYWNDDIDIDPDYLYDIGMEAKEQGNIAKVACEAKVSRNTVKWGMRELKQEMSTKKVSGSGRKEAEEDHSWKRIAPCYQT